MDNPLVEETVFKGQPVLRMKRGVDDVYPFTIGVTKARLILDSFMEINRFWEKHRAKYIETHKWAKKDTEEM